MKTYNQLKEMFLASNQAFIRDDKDLLDSQVSERSLCGALMLHLNRLMLRSEDFEGYYTDVEYNRNRGNIKTIKKTIRGQEEQMPEICKYLGISREPLCAGLQQRICLPIRSGRTGSLRFQK